MGKRLLFFDGAMGTMLQESGLPAGAAPEPWNLTHPECHRSIHRAYLEAGSICLKPIPSGPTLSSFMECSTEKAVAADGFGQGGHPGQRAGRLVALDIGPTGRLLRPMGDLDFEEAYEAFRETALYGEQAGRTLSSSKP